MGARNYFQKIMRTLPHVNNIILGPFIRENTKGKAIPLPVWTASEDSRGLRLSYFNTIGT